MTDTTARAHTQKAREAAADVVWNATGTAQEIADDVVRAYLDALDPAEVAKAAMSIPRTATCAAVLKAVRP